jgi:hypothetical protein
MNKLVDNDWLTKDSHGLTINVRQKVEKSLGRYYATPEEIEQTFQHLVAR